MNKIKVLILFGGKSAEHEVSLLSARNVYSALDKKKYDITMVGIDRDGQWYLNQQAEDMINFKNPALLKLNELGSPVTLAQTEKSTQLVPTHAANNSPSLKSVDVVFPVLHGPMGEDGTVQGMLKLLNLPFVGPSVLGSAVGMDKDVMKRLLKEAGVPISKFVTIRKNQKMNFEEVKNKLGLPMFVKPANMGSSVGVSKVKSEADFHNAISEAFKYDNKIIIEEFIEGREIECSVLGNENPRASVPGEVINNVEFYSYEAKYIDPNAAKTKIPADLDPATVKRVQDMAIQTFQVLECEGMGRVDFFLKKDGSLLVNEINTIPGFTKISMYPQMWEASGLSYSSLIDELIKLALERHKRDSQIQIKPSVNTDGFKA